MKTPNMLYRCPGPETFEGVACETTVVDEDEVEAKLAEGWHRDWVQAGQVAQEAAAQLQANEEEQKRIAEELAKAGQSATGLKAVHKGRGVWDVQDADGAVVQTGLTGEQAKAAAAG